MSLLLEEVETNGSEEHVRQYSLTPAEKETIVLWDQESGLATVDTHDVALITKLTRNPRAKCLERGRHGHSPYAKFSLPKGLVSFRTGKRQISEAQKTALVANLAAHRARSRKPAA